MLQFYLNLCNIYFLFPLCVLLSALILFCCDNVYPSVLISHVFYFNFVLNYILTCINFLVYSLCIYCAEFTINFSGFDIPSVLEFYLSLYI